MENQSRSPRKRMKRVERTGAVRFVTFSCYRRLPLLNHDAIKQVFVDRLAAIHHEKRIELFGWVVMPEHVHLLVRPSKYEQSLSLVLQSLKRPVAERVLRRWRKLDAPILDRLVAADGRTIFWQRGGGYDRNIVSLEEFEEKLQYIHCNPVKRGLVDQATDWVWSSARGCVDDVVSGRVQLDRIA